MLEQVLIQNSKLSVHRWSMIHNICIVWYAEYIFFELDAIFKSWNIAYNMDARLIFKSENLAILDSGFFIKVYQLL